MQNVQPSLFARDHTFFGVCEGLGEDFRFNPLYLRIALAVPLFFFPAETIGTYAAAGAVVLLSRLLFPDPRAAVVKETRTRPAPEPAAVEPVPAADGMADAAPVPLAA
ncbi:MAG: PspC domain-containing protein [Pseudomonadota bacterium]|nr:PspC domain-containing protein [Pseudomonadota bacterium]